MKTTRFKLVSMALPYVAVYVGLYVLKSAWITIGLYHFGIMAFLIADDPGKLLKSIRSGWNFTAAVISIVVCALIIPVIFIFWQYMQLEDTCLRATLTDFGLYGSSWYFFMIYFSTVQPFLEELYWRSYLENSHKFFSLTDLAFAGYHIFILAWFIKLPWLVVAFIVLTAVAYGFRYIACRFKGLAVPLLSHIAADISIITAANLLIRQSQTVNVCA